MILRRVTQHPLLTLGAREDAEWGLFTKNQTLVPELHTLVLNAPLDVACKDDALLKAFHVWEYWQGIIPNLARGMQETLEDSREALKL